MKKVLVFVWLMISTTTIVLAEEALPMTGHGEAAELMNLMSALNVFSVALFFASIILFFVSFFLKKDSLFGFSFWHASIILFFMVLSVSIYPEMQDNREDLATLMMLVGFLLMIGGVVFSIINKLKKAPDPSTVSKEDKTILDQETPIKSVYGYFIAAFGLSIVALNVLQILATYVDILFNIIFALGAAFVVFISILLAFLLGGKEAYENAAVRAAISRRVLVLFIGILAFQWLIYKAMELNRLFWTQPPV